MTVTINGSTGIDKVQDGTIQSADFAAGVPARSNLPAGTVLQVVQGTLATNISTTSGSYVDTGLTASITPTSSTSKILVLVSIASIQKSNANNNVSMNIVRGSTQLIVITGEVLFNNPIGELRVSGPSASYLDSPATTSSITYKVQWKTNTVGTCYMNSGTDTSTITLMEIAA